MHACRTVATATSGGPRQPLHVRAHADESRSRQRQSRLTQNKRGKVSTPYVLKARPLVVLVEHLSPLRPPPPVTVTENFRNGRRGNTPFGHVVARGPQPGRIVPATKMMPRMRMPCVARGPSQACQRARLARGKYHSAHAKSKAIGSSKKGRRTRHLRNPRAESLPGTRLHTYHAPTSGETTDFATRFDFFRWSKSQIPVSGVIGSTLEICFATSVLGDGGGGQPLMPPSSSRTSSLSGQYRVDLSKLDYLFFVYSSSYCLSRSAPVLAPVHRFSSSA